MNDINAKFARDFAEAAHAGQVDHNGSPYIEHLSFVGRQSLMLANLFYGHSEDNEDIEIAGYLHDVLEDTNTTAPILTGVGFSDRVVRTVQAVTRVDRWMSYKDFISGVIDSGPDACIVKLADLTSNTLPERIDALPISTRDRLMKKYSPAIERVQKALDMHG